MQIKPVMFLIMPAGFSHQTLPIYAKLFKAVYLSLSEMHELGSLALIANTLYLLEHVTKQKLFPLEHVYYNPLPGWMVLEHHM